MGPVVSGATRETRFVVRRLHCGSGFSRDCCRSRLKHGANAKILVVDALEDFGGHAKRNEFEVDGRTLIGYFRQRPLDFFGMSPAYIPAPDGNATIARLLIAGSSSTTP
jgi:hypothetical protein